MSVRVAPVGRATPLCDAEDMNNFPPRIPLTAVHGPDARGDSDEPLVIDCDTCVVRESDACADCVMSFLLDQDHEESTAVVLDLEEIRALRALGEAGLVPTLRHRASG